MRCCGVAVSCGDEVKKDLTGKAFRNSKVVHFILHIPLGQFVWSNVFCPEAFAGSLRERSQPYMQFAISYRRWNPYLGIECLPTNLNYGTLIMSEYGRPPGG
jgi:hypothetical protein